MEYILKGTDIFDLNICKKVEVLLSKNNLSSDLESWYRLEVIFHVNLLKSEKLKDYYKQYVSTKSVSNDKQENQKDFIYGVLGNVLKNIQSVFERNNINLDDLWIVGDEIESKDTIILKLSTSNKYLGNQKSSTDKKSKTPEHIIVRNIVPSRISINKKVRNLVEEAMNKRFDNYLEITDTRIMSQILDVDITDNINILFKEFVNQYVQYFALHRDDEVDALHEKFKERAVFVWNNYYAKEGETVVTNKLS